MTNCIYEIYNVPDDEWDDEDVEFIDYATDKDSANNIFEEAVKYFGNVWMIEVDESTDDIKVVRT